MKSRSAPPNGFTLVELMLVVAIIGILSAVAIPAMSKYVKKARTVEAPGQIFKMWAGALAYYEADHADSTGVQTKRVFPGADSASGTVGTSCCGKGPGDMCPGNDSLYQTDAVWKALSFNMSQPYHYRPLFRSYDTNTTPPYCATFPCAYMHVAGDLDCDSILAQFFSVGYAPKNTSNAIESDMGQRTAMFIVNELE
jgi:prepilin-type N-terminal cleavage/methylation domain-containing protein